MRIAEVIGSVTLSRSHPSLVGARWRLVVPLTAEQIADGPGDREAIVAYDEQSSGRGQRVAISEGAEASAPFHPQQKPIDAYVSAQLDAIEISPPRSSS